MKILILYTARSGTNNICSYFLKQNSNYKFFNQPFSSYDEDGIVKTSYDECIKHKNVLIKSTIFNLKRLNISKEQLLIDFDKVLLISRKNKKEQAISYTISSRDKSFLKRNKKDYYIDGSDIDILNKIILFLEEQHNDLVQFLDNSFRFFYYEDLYYNDFTKLFEYLGIEFIQKDFDTVLDIKNKYVNKHLDSKQIKTLI
jgi:hypothetical protein